MISETFLYNLKTFCNENNMDETHNYEHFIAVYEHAQKALLHHSNISQDNQQAILYAALLHDVDDHKFFPKNINYENARKLLEGVSRPIINMTIYMISLVSCSFNGNSQKGIFPEWEWLLIPRIADRLEAIGRVGIYRVIAYGQHVGRPMHNESTERAHTREELERIASDERFKGYMAGKRSNTTIDHFYDKLLHIGKWENFGINNEYLTSIAKQRHEEMVYFVLDYWKRHISV